MCIKYSLKHRLESAIPLLLRELGHLPVDQKIAIAFPDDGAYKRFHCYFEDKPTIICFKKREGHKRIVKVKDGRYIRKKILIYIFSHVYILFRKIT